MAKLSLFNNNLFNNFKRIKKTKKNKKNTKIRIIAGALCLALISGIAWSLFHPSTAGAAWFDDNFAYRKPISFVHNADITTERRVTVTVDTATLITAGKMQSDCDDSRFTDISGKSLRYQLTGTCNNAATTYDVVYPSIINGTNTSYFYYGNPSATSESQDVSGVTAATPSGSISLSTEEKAVSPAGWWKLDSGYGTTAYDASQNANNGTLGGAIGGAGGTAKIRQELNIIDTTLSGTNAVISSNGQVQLDTTQYDGTVTYYFEVVASATSGSTGSIRLRRNGTTTDDATISLSTVAADAGSVRRYRSSSFTPPASTQTTYFIYGDAAGASKTVTISAARIIVTQSSTSNLTKTESQFEIGNMETGKSNTGLAELSNPKYWTYTSANWAPTPSFYAEVTYKVNEASTPTTETFSTAGTTSWQAPTGVTSVDVELWGGGGAGGGDTTTGSPGGSGGGGGAYVKSTVAVTPGNSYSVVRGSAGTTGTGTGGNGGNSTFNTTTVIAEGGKGGAGNGGAAGAGGNTTVSVGDIENPGGSGFVSASTTGGGGGGSGGSGATGNTATSGTGATAVTNGGAGGNGGASGNDGTAPAAGPGGGGGGAGGRSGGNRSGGAGFAGKAVLTYNLPNTDFVNIRLQEDDGSFANWTDVTNGSIVTTGTATTTTRVRSTSGFTPVNGHHYKLVAGISNSASTYDIYNAKIIVTADSSYTEFDSYNESNWAAGTCSLDAGGNNGCSQSFQTTISGSLTKAQFYLAKTGTPTGNIVAKLYAHSGTFGSTSIPTGTALATSDNVSVASLTTSMTIYSFTFTGAQQYALSNATNYVIALEYNGTSASTVTVGTVSLGTHNGNAAAKFNTTWSASGTFDTVFHIYYNSGVLTSFESQYLLANTGSIGGATGLKDYDTGWDPAEWSSVTNSYYHEANGVSSGTGDVKLQSDPNGTPADVTNSTITDTIESERSSALTMPVAASDIDVNVTGTGTLNASKIVVTSTLSTIGAGTTVGAPTWKNKDYCLTDACLYFPGSDAAVKITNANPIDFDKGLSGGVTFSAWIRVNDAGEGSSGYIFNKGANTYLKVGNLSGGKLDLIASMDLGTTDATVTVTGGLTQSKWHYVAMGYTDDSDDEITVYIDGNATTSTNGVGSPATDANDLVIGHNATSAGTFHGYIDDFRIYNFERTTAQIKTIAVNAYASNEGASAIMGAASRKFLTDNLVAYYKMDDGTGVSTVESTRADGQGGVFYEGAASLTAGPTWTTGKFGSGINFPGTDDVVRIAETTSTDLGATTDSYTVSAWAKFTSCPSSCTLVAKDDGTGAQPFNLMVNSSGAACTLYISDGTDTSGGMCFGNSYNDGAWHLFTGIRNAKDKLVMVYVDGVLVLSQTDITTASLANNDNISIGNGSSSYIANDFTGQIDDVRIYNRALSGYEISALSEWAPGPVGYWKLDEPSGSTAYDSSGNGQSGTWNGNTASTTGKYGKGAIFDGSGDYISVANFSSYLANSTAMTISGWVNTTSTASQNYGFFGIRNSGPTAAFYINQLSGGNSLECRFANSSGTIYDATNTVSTGWNYVTLVYNGSNITCYVNGVPGTPVTASGSFTSTTVPFAIGTERTDAAQSYFNGKADEVKVYSYARTAKQIISDMNGGHPSVGSPVGSAVAHWRFDEGYGDTGNNVGSAGSAINADLGTSTGSCPGDSKCPTWTNSGKFNKALSFDGTSDETQVPDNNAIDFDYNQDFTISTWVKPGTTQNNTTTTDNSIIDKGAASPFPYRIRINNQTDPSPGLIYAVRNDGTHSPVLPSVHTINDNNWHHIIFAKTGSLLSLYIDGKLEGTTTDTTTTTTTNASVLGIGSNGSSARWFTGSIDEVKIYNYGLSANEVYLDYNRGKSQLLGSLSTASDGVTADNSSARSYCVPGDTATCSAPIGEWWFNEGSGTTSYDTSTSGNSGTISNPASPSWSQGKQGKSLNFDSTLHTKVDAGNASTFNNLSAVSVSMWIYPRSKGGNSEARFIDKSASTGPTSGWYFKFNSTDNAMTFQVDYSTTDLVSKSVDTIPFNQWSHIALTWDGSSSSANVHMYLNGKEVSYTGTVDGVGSRADDSTANFKIGDQQGTNYRTFDGLIDSVLLYNYVRSNKQVAWDYNRGGPIGWWKLDECTGTTAYDSSGNGKNGTITIGATSTYTSAGTCSSGTSTEAWNAGTTGRFNSGLGFDGSDDYVSIGDVDPYKFERTNPFSLSAWFKTSTSTGQSLIAKQNNSSNDQGYNLQLGGSGFVFLQIANNYSTNAIEVGSANSVSYADGNWHMLTGTYDGSSSASGVTLYFDGKPIAMTTSKNNLSATIITTSPLQLGARSGAAQQFLNGLLDDARIYNFTLNATQVRTLYNENFTTRFGPATGSP